MPDYGHDLQFGVFLTPDAAAAKDIVRTSQLAEEVGLDLVTFQDHPYQGRFLDALTLLTYVAASTSTIRVAPNVANLPLRPPAVLAKSLASLDVLSGGRAELAIGAGGFWEAIGAYGGRRLAPGESVDALAEAIAVIRAVWGDGRDGIRLTGEHYQLSGAHPGPPPAHDIAVWIGAMKSRMLRLTGRLGDGWLPSSAYVGPEKLAAANAIIDAAAREAHRDPREIRRLYNLMGRFGTRPEGFLQGPPGLWAQQLADLALGEGMSTYILASDDPDDIRRFAGEVAPEVRELVAAARIAQPADRQEALVVTAPTPNLPTHASRARPAAGPFRPVATAPPAQPMSTVAPWREDDRPTGPAADPQRLYTPHEQAVGQHLIDVHDYLRAELAQVHDLVGQVTDGSLDPGAARSQINAMTMRQNAWTVGAYCQSYCRIVTTHHGLEDQSVFPHLRAAEADLAPVLDRLEAEHHTIHEVLEDVDRALVRFVTDGDADALLAALALLNDALLSHLSYEERELIEPLARLSFS